MNLYQLTGLEGNPVVTNANWGGVQPTERSQACILQKTILNHSYEMEQYLITSIHLKYAWLQWRW